MDSDKVETLFRPSLSLDSTVTTPEQLMSATELARDQGWAPAAFNVDSNGGLTVSQGTEVKGLHPESQQEQHTSSVLDILHSNAIEIFSRSLPSRVYDEIKSWTGPSHASNLVEERKLSDTATLPAGEAGSTLNL